MNLKPLSMKRIHHLLAVFVILIIPVQTNAQVGITGVPFLQIEPDSRGAGMGNTGTAIADNAAAIFWNPAGLAFQRGSQLSITHSNWLPNFNVGLFYDYLVGKTYIDGIGTIGGHITYLNLGEQNQTGSTGSEIINRFRSYELAVGLSYGFEVNKNFAIGTGFRFIYSSLAGGFVGGAAGGVDAQQVNPGSSVGVDLAFLYKSNPFALGSNGRQATFSIGSNLSNVGPGIQYTDNAQKDPLPTVLRLGTAFTMDLDDKGINSLTVTTDVSKVMARQEQDITIAPDGRADTSFVAASPFDAIFNSWGSFSRFNGSETVTLGLLQQLQLGVGAEYWYNNSFALRTGYYYEDPENGDRKFLTFGAGLKYDFIGVDFSYIQTLESDHPLAGTLRFSLLFNF